MTVFTRYAHVLNASGEAVSVRDALALINQTLDEVLRSRKETSTPTPGGLWLGLSNRDLPKGTSV